MRTERNAGYDRSKFRHWVDADRDCRDTRDEVLAQESRVRVRGCDVRRGRWFSYYDRRTWRRAGAIDVDHLVPLAEAWGSGAKRWNAGTRRRFANDLRDRRALVAVTDNVNQSKGARDPAQWLPRYGKCRYVRQWTAVKSRWDLSVNRREKRRMANVAGRCRNTVLRWREARIVKRSTRLRGSITARGVQFVWVVYNADGADGASNANAERLKIVNTTRRAKNMTGWKLIDAAGNRNRFPRFRLRAGERVVVHSGNGRDRRHHLYAGWGHTWNNTGDLARLRNRAGRLADRCGWGDGPGRRHC